MIVITIVCKYLKEELHYLQLGKFVVMSKLETNPPILSNQPLRLCLKCFSSNPPVASIHFSGANRLHSVKEVAKR